MEYGGLLGAFPEGMISLPKIRFGRVMICANMTSALWQRCLHPSGSGILGDAILDMTWKRGFGNGEFMFICFSGA
jgi:hypothetical protein